MASFDSILSQKSIFKNLSVLSPHYVPEELPFRKEHLEEMMTVVSPALKGQKPRNLFIYGKTGTGKCIHGETPVLLGNGSLGRARDLFAQAMRSGRVISEDSSETWVEYPIEIQSWNPRTKRNVKKKITKCYRQKMAGPLLKIVTATGREITVTDNHPFYTLKDGCCIQHAASHLEEGSYIPVLKKFSAASGASKDAPIAVLSDGGREVRTFADPSPEIAEFMGYGLGDGCEDPRGNRLIFCNSDQLIFDRFKELTTTCFGIPPGSCWKHEKRTPQVCITSKNLRGYMEKYLSHRFGAKSSEKDIPDAIMSAPDEVVAPFLRAIFDCEAYVSRRDAYMEFSTASREMANKISYLLARFGIFSIIKKKLKCATNTKERKIRPYYALLIYGTRDLSTYYKKIGFRSKKKMEVLASKIDKTANQNIDIIPNIGNRLRYVREKLGISAAEFGCKELVYPYEKGMRNPSSRKLEEFLDFFSERYHRLQVERKELAEGSSSIYDAIATVPITREELAELLSLRSDAMNYHIRKRSKSFEERFSGQCREILIGRIDSILSDRGLMETIAELRSHINSDIIWDRVVSIERVDNEEQYVYDFEVPEAHTFISGFGGIVSHNTCCMKRVMDDFQKIGEKKGASMHYVNCRIYNSRYRIMQKIMKSYVPELEKSGFGLPFLYEKLIEVCSKGEQMVVILDEIDMTKDLDELVYTLTRSNDEIKNGGVSIVGISNKLSFKDSLDPRSKSSLYETEMIFQPYSAEQLQKILEQRVGQGFEKDVVSSSAINLAAAITSQESGDARYALKLLNKAGEVAEQSGKNKVTDEDVETARRKVEIDLTAETISTLPEMHQIVLYTICDLSVSGSRYARLEGMENSMLFSGEVYEEYERVCKRLRKRPRSSRWYKEYLSDLEVLGLITTTPSGKGVRGQTTLIRMGHEPKNVFQMLKKNLFI